MRIFLLLAAAGAAAIGTAAAAAAARPGGGSAGPGAGPAWSPVHGVRHGVRAGWEARSRPGVGRHHRRPGHHRDGRGPKGRHGAFYYDGFGIAWPGGSVSPFGNGFFAGGGGEVRLRGGRPYYDYDRSYPYEWAPGAGDRHDWNEAERSREPAPRCTFENSVRVCRGG